MKQNKVNTADTLIVKSKKPTGFKSALRKLKALVGMQLKDKMDLTWIKSTKTMIQKVVLSLIMFILITFATYTILNYCITFGIFYYSDIIKVAIVFTTIILLLSTISCSFALMKNLFIADDNKVLTTFPVTNNILFFSKLIVYYIYELKKNLSFFIPILLGFLLVANKVGRISFWAIIWSVIPLMVIIALPVLFGSLISIPLLYINRLFKKIPIFELIVILLFVGAGIGLSIYLINLIPENIDFANQWPIISESIKRFLRDFVIKLNVFSQLFYILVGRFDAGKLSYIISGQTFLNFFYLLLIFVLLIVVTSLIAKPLFFKMMSKSFEFDKKLYDKPQENNVHRPFITFINKEFKINFRSIEISGNYIATYIIIPILILLLNSVFAAMNSKLSGVIMTYSFNLLLILLPLLASNSMIATLYSKEGRTGYMKKTKPINPLMPLISKLLFNLLLSIPCIVVTMFIFARFSHFNIINALLLSLAVLLIQYGHIFYSATLDIINPQNEQYATTGESISNPNENKATIVAFVISILFALASYKLFTESILHTNSFFLACLKLCLIGLAIFGGTLILFILKVKVYYYER